MRVILNGYAADWVEVLSEVPQGSVLGPLLFLIYVDELHNIVRTSIKLFANDTKTKNKKLRYRLKTGRQRCISLYLSYFLSP